MSRFVRLFAMVLAFSGTVNGQGGWTWENPLPQGNNLYGVCALGAQTAVAVGDKGTVIKTVDEGASWSVQSYAGGIDACLKDVFFMNASTGWIVGTGGTILKTADAGETWVPQESGIADDLNGIFFLDDQTGWAVGKSGAVRKTTDGGQTWNGQTSNTGSELTAVQFVDGNTGWVVGLQGTVLHTNDGGAAWIVQTSNTEDELRSVHFRDVRNGFAVGGTRLTTQYDAYVMPGTGIILSTTDGGTTWVPEQKDKYLYSTCFVTPETGWAVSSSWVGGHSVMKTLDGGSTWTEQDLVYDWDYYALLPFDVDFCDTLNGWIVGNLGNIYNTDDGGITWNSQRVDRFDCTYIGPLFFLDSRQGWMIAEDREWGGEKVFTSIDGGLTWEEKARVNLDIRTDMQFVNPDTGWITSMNGQIYRTGDGGVTWHLCNSDWVTELNPPDVYPDVRDCFFLNADTGWAVGRQCFIICTHDGGNTWICQDRGTGYSCDYLWSVHFVNADTGWAVGFRRSSGGETADMLRSSTDGEDGGPPDELTVSGRRLGETGGVTSLLLKTTDGGENWLSQAIPVSDIELRKVYFANCDTGWVFGSGGTILKTNDAGETLVKQSSGRSEDIGYCFFLDAETGWVRYGDGGVLHTEDGGEHWMQQRTGSSSGYYIFFRDRENGILAGGFGTFLRTNTGGDTWVPGRPDQDSPKPKTTLLFQNYPNPFNPSTRINYILPKTGPLKIVLYDVLGRKVKTLFEGIGQAGLHEMDWEAEGLPSGEYIVVLELDGMKESRKMILEK